MFKSLLLVFVLLVTISSLAQTPILPATDVSHSDIDAFISALPPNVVSDKPIRAVDVGGYRVGVFGVLRPNTIAQEANAHDTRTCEIYYILDGSATLVTGGKIPNPHPLSTGSTTMQGARIDGGVSRRVTKGDVVIIPGRTPHWFSSQDATLRYLIFRPDPDGKLALK